MCLIIDQVLLKIEEKKLVGVPSCFHLHYEDSIMTVRDLSNLQKLRERDHLRVSFVWFRFWARGLRSVLAWVVQEAPRRRRLEGNSKMSAAQVRTSPTEKEGASGGSRRTWGQEGGRTEPRRPGDREEPAWVKDRCPGQRQA